MDISLTKLPWYAQVGAFVALAIAGVVVFYTLYEKPLHADMEQRQGQLELIRKDIAKGRATAEKLDDFRAQVSELESRLTDLQAVLPQEKDAAALLRSMQTVAMQSSLSIRVFKPEVPITKPLHAEWPIALEIDGTYHDLAVFFDRVGRFTRIVNISALQIEAKDKPGPSATISARCVATTFVLLEALPPNAKGSKTTKGNKAAGAEKKAA
jgi:type IV pilus assembly protein PilO